jgi:hypothetical protein
MKEHTMPVSLAKSVDLSKRTAPAPVIVCTVDMGARPARIDRKRAPSAKARTVSRRTARRMKLTAAFLAFAFPADLSAFAAR